MDTPDIIRSASVHWTGDVAHGRGSISTGSGKVAADYSFGTRFSGDPGTNPEELLGAAHAACFTMAISGVLTRAGHPPTSLDTTAHVYLRKVEGGFEIAQIELELTGTVPGVTAAEFTQMATQAKEACPLSKALRATPISLTATLSS